MYIPLWRLLEQAWTVKQDATLVQRIPLFQARFKTFISGLVQGCLTGDISAPLPLPSFPLDDPPLIDTHHLVVLDRLMLALLPCRVHFGSTFSTYKNCCMVEWNTGMEYWNNL